MKLDKYIFSTFIAAAALALGSCSGFLDRSPQGQFTEDDNPNALVNGKIYNVYTLSLIHICHFNLLKVST